MKNSNRACHPVSKYGAVALHDATIPHAARYYNNIPTTAPTGPELLHSIGMWAEIRMAVAILCDREILVARRPGDRDSDHDA